MSQLLISLRRYLRSLEKAAEELDMFKPKPPTFGELYDQASAMDMRSILAHVDGSGAVSHDTKCQCFGCACEAVYNLRLAFYKAGLYTIQAPPGPTARWVERDWLVYCDASIRRHIELRKDKP